MDPLTAMTLMGSLVQMGLMLKGQDDESRANEQMARENKRLAEMAAQDALARGSREAGEVRQAGARIADQAMVNAAASGVDPTVGTPAAISAQSMAAAELDAQVIANSAAREAWGFRAQGAQFGKAAQREREMRPYRQASTVLGTVGRFADSYSRRAYPGGERERSS